MKAALTTKDEPFDVTEENQLYQLGGAILSYLPGNLENPSFVHVIKLFILLPQISQVTLQLLYWSLAFILDLKWKVFILPSPTNRGWQWCYVRLSWNHVLVLRVKGELCTSCNTQARYDCRSPDSKEFQNSPATFGQHSLVVPISGSRQKQQGFGATSDRQPEWNARTFSRWRRRLRHDNFSHRQPFQSVFSAARTSWLMHLFVSARVFLSYFRTIPSPLWQIGCSSQLVTAIRPPHMVNIAHINESLECDGSDLLANDKRMEIRFCWVAILGKLNLLSNLLNRVLHIDLWYFEFGRKPLICYWI